MTLAAARTELTLRLRTDMNWAHAIVSEYETYSNMPAILLTVSNSIDDEDIAGDTAKYDLTAEMRTRFDDTAGIDFHRDHANATGLAGALDAIEEAGLECSTLITQGSEMDTMTVDLDDGTSRVEYSYVRVECDWYITR